MREYNIYLPEELVKYAQSKGMVLDYDNKFSTAPTIYQDDPNDPDRYIFYSIPTIEQVCGWLRQCGIDVWVEWSSHSRKYIGRACIRDKGLDLLTYDMYNNYNNAYYAIIKIALDRL